MKEDEKNMENKSNGYFDKEQDRKKDMISETAVKYVFEKMKKHTIEDYYTLPDEERVELIDGVFYDMAAPTTIHQKVGFKIALVLEKYVRMKEGKCEIYLGPIDVQLDCDEWTMVQPDVMVICDRDKIKIKNIYGAPDFVIEVLSPSTARKDMTIKLEKYRKAGVREYWMIDIEKEKVLVYEFEKENNPVIYGMNSHIPVGIFGGECVIEFGEIYEEIKDMKSRG